MKKVGKQAFTLIEIMIVLVIITLMLLLVYAPYNFYQQKAKVKVAGREIAQSIYEARNLAISGKAFKDGGDDKNKSIGIVLEEGKDEILYYEFDILKVETPSSVTLPSSSKVPFKRKDLQKGVTIKELEQGSSTSTKVLLFFESITGKLYITNLAGSGKYIKINFGIKDATGTSLNNIIKYYPKTNTTFYKTQN